MTRKYFFLRLVPCEESKKSFDNKTSEETIEDIEEELIDKFISKWSDMLKIEGFELEKILFEEVD